MAPWAANRLTRSGTPQKRAKLAHGVRQAVTSNSAVPTRQRSPSRASAQVEPGGAQVLAEPAGRQLAAELGDPEVGVLLGVGVDRLPLAAVVLPVDLDVAVQAERVDGDPAGDRPLVDAGAVRAAGPGSGSRSAAGDADRARRRPGHFLEAVDSLVESAATNASWGTSTRPTIFIRFLPSFCFSSSLRLRVMSPP